MQNTFENRVVRPVRIVTTGPIIDGLLNISLGGRTLDELNLSARSFLTLTNPQVQRGGSEMSDGPAAVNKASILFVLEIPDLGAAIGRSPEDPELRRFGRAAVRLRVQEYDIEGYMHVGAGAQSLLRLNQAVHPFIALQSATVKGPEMDLTAPFLAVNRPQILSAQELFSVSLVPEEVGVGTTGEKS